MHYLYKYLNKIPLFNTDTNNLENEVMFNEELKLYKGFNNPITFRVRNRDRVHVNLDDALVKFVIINDYTSLEVSTFYLSVSENGKILTADIKASDLEDIEEGSGYSFMASLVSVDPDTDEELGEEPLYIDHNFNVTAPVEIMEPIKQPLEITSDHKVDRYDRFKQWQESEYVFLEIIYTDERFISLHARAKEEGYDGNILLQKHSRNDYPLDVEDEKQWLDVMMFYNVDSEGVELPVNDFLNYRVVVRTEHPEQLEIVIKKTPK